MFGPPKDDPNGLIARGGRDRFHSEYAPRFEERRNFGLTPRMGQNDLQASRHLWVGNLSPHVTETALAEQFLRFGELESIALYPGRCYAFVNFRKEEDASIALRGLQGFVIAGLPLRVEFAKGVSSCKFLAAEAEVAKHSRHLYVTGICPSISGEELEAEFRSIGVLESFKLDLDQGIALIDYAEKDDAIAAVASLNGKRIGREELRIDYGRPQAEVQERPLPSSPVPELLQNRDERRAAELGDPFSQRDFRTHGTSSENLHFKAKRGKNAEPSEILWIGFPASLDVDEMILRRAFAPYGEINQITTFPGRSYAFVKYKSVVAACRAKDALQGKLFNNPRVNICFAKSEIGAVEHGRSSANSFFPSQTKSFGRPFQGGRVFENIRNDRNFGSSFGESCMESSPVSNFDKTAGDSSRNGGFGQNSRIQTCPGVISNAGGTYETMRFQGLGSKLGPSGDLYENPRISPGVDRGALWRDAPLESSRRRSPLFDDSWDSSDNVRPFREAKKLKTELLPDKELPEYPFSDLGQEKQHIGIQKPFHAMSEPESYDKSYESGHFGLKAVSQPLKNLWHQEKDDFWNARDSFEVGSSPLYMKPVQRDRVTPDSHHSPLNEEWKWQGTIAKGGTPVCRARCFPVGKALNIILPEFLDCTARTGLDMLSKHFFQAASVGVIFFVPESDSDIVLYNEFMHYLGEKQRAAVAKLGEKTTLFLVPPSEFSEKVLKVPGKVSISGVILRFQHPNSNFSLQNPPNAIESKPTSLIHHVTDDLGSTDDKRYTKPCSPDFKSLSWGQIYMGSSSETLNLASSPFCTLNMPVAGNISYLGNGEGLASSASFVESISSRTRLPEPQSNSRLDQLPDQNLSFRSNWSSPQPRNLNAGNFLTSSSFHDDPMLQEYLPVKPRPLEGASSGPYTPGSSGNSLASGVFSQEQNKLQVSSSMPVPHLHPEQLTQLASLLAQQQQPSGQLPVLLLGEDRKREFLNNQSEQTFKPQKSSSQSFTTAASESLAPQLQQNTSNGSGIAHASHAELQTLSSAEATKNQLQNGGNEDTETDPQKRLQATLQLAAALLQQIQQQANNKSG